MNANAARVIITSTCLFAKEVRSKEKIWNGWTNLSLFYNCLRLVFQKYVLKNICPSILNQLYFVGLLPVPNCKRNNSVQKVEIYTIFYVCISFHLSFKGHNSKMKEGLPEFHFYFKLLANIIFISNY